MVYYKCLEHFDKFGDAEVIYWVDVSGVPERLVDEAKRIDGADYSDGCFGVCIQHDRETGEFAAMIIRGGHHYGKSTYLFNRWQYSPVVR